MTKNLILIIVVVLMGLSGYSQQRIRLNDGSVIKDIRLHEVREQYIIYEKRQSLHNLEKYLIYWVETDTAYIKFRPDGTKCIMRKMMPRDEDFECFNDEMEDRLLEKKGSPYTVDGCGWRRWEVL